MHYHVVREYIGQLMKSNYSCKSRKHEKAAAKIRQQWEDLRALFKDTVQNTPQTPGWPESQQGCEK